MLERAGKIAAGSWNNVLEQIRKSGNFAPPGASGSGFTAPPVRGGVFQPMQTLPFTDPRLQGQKADFGRSPFQQILAQQSFQPFTGATPFGAAPGGTADFKPFTASYTSPQDIINQHHAREAATNAEVQISGGDPGNTQGLAGTYQWQDMINEAASRVGIPAVVIQAIMGIESQGRMLGANGAGAVGLMQVVPEYWADLGYDLNDPFGNIMAGATVLRSMYEKYGSWELAAAAYLGSIEQDENGNWRPSSTEADMYGTTGVTYVDAFKNNIAYLQNQQGAENLSIQDGSPVDIALQLQGLPYVWGGQSLEQNGFDCSGLVYFAFNEAGFDIPDRTAAGYYEMTTRVGSQDLRPGDLVFFSIEGDLDHVGIYIGNGQFIQATSNGGDVHVTDLSDPFYAQHIVGYGRFPGTSMSGSNYAEPAAPSAPSSISGGTGMLTA